jgi:hypothetical protein
LYRILFGVFEAYAVVKVRDVFGPIVGRIWPVCGKDTLSAVSAAAFNVSAGPPLSVHPSDT